MMRAIFGAALVSLFALNLHAQPRQTDREFDRLKGPVKSVIVEVGQFKYKSGEFVEHPRVLARTVTYDADGNCTQTKEYDDEGNLRQSNVFSYIGADRVIIAEDVDNPKALVFIQPLRTRRRIDPRYTYKLKYIYGRDGTRSQELVYFSSGSLYLRHVYKFKGNRTVKLLYGVDRKLNNRIEFVYDEKGNEVELLLYQQVADKIVYEYLEFDSQDNWTKRVEKRGFRDVPTSDFAKIKPWSIEYRTITYH